MSFPHLYFVDRKGNPLKRDEDDIQYIHQYGGQWRVRVDGVSQGKVYLDGSPLLALQKVHRKNNEWQLPQSSDEERKKITGSGYIKAIFCDDLGNDICQATLLVFPGNVTEVELNQMIKEIGQLALSTASYVYRHIEVGQGEGFGIRGVGQQWHPGEGLLATATSLLKLYKVTKENWHLLEKRPLKSFMKQIAPINLHKAKNSTQALLKSKIEPYEKNILAVTQVESNHCSENEFICYLLDVYLKDLANCLADSLEALEIDNINVELISEFKSIRRNDSIFENFKQKSLDKAKQFNEDRNKLNDEKQQKINDLKECACWATQARQSSFLKNVNTPNKLPKISYRLKGSPAYGTILSQFFKCTGNVLKPIQQVVYLLKTIYEGRVRTTWEIYELWCFLKLYSAFILYANMKPYNNLFVFEHLQVTPEGIKLPSNIEFTLECILEDGNHFKINFWYDTLFRGKRPDIRLEVSNDGKVQQFCFDAKYKNYQKKGWKVLTDDILGTARNKYLKLLNSTASFILHTDETIDYWGEKPLSEILKNYVPDLELKEKICSDSQEYF